MALTQNQRTLNFASEVRTFLGTRGFGGMLENRRHPQNRLVTVMTMRLSPTRHRSGQLLWGGSCLPGTSCDAYRNPARQMSSLP